MGAVAVIGMACGNDATPIPPTPASVPAATPAIPQTSEPPPAATPAPASAATPESMSMATQAIPPTPAPPAVLDGSAFADDIAVCAEGLSEITTRAVCVTEEGLVVLTAKPDGHSVARERCLIEELGADAPRILAAAGGHGADAPTDDDFAALFAAADRCA